jgi:hypothetical protein
MEEAGIVLPESVGHATPTCWRDGAWLQASSARLIAITGKSFKVLMDVQGRWIA